MKRRSTDIDMPADLGDRVIQVTQSLGRIDLDNLGEEIEESGAWATFYGMMSARATRRADTAEALKDEMFARAKLRAREDAQRRSVRLTDEQAKELASVDADYLAAQKEWIARKEAAKLVESTMFTLGRKQATCQELVRLLTEERLAHLPPKPQKTRSPM